MLGLYGMVGIQARPASGQAVETASGATVFPTKSHGADGHLFRANNGSYPVVCAPRAHGRPGALQQSKTWRLGIGTSRLLVPEKCCELVDMDTDYTCSTDTQRSHQVGMSVWPWCRALHFTMCCWRGRGKDTLKL
jgi:hypothetical protein